MTNDKYDQLEKIAELQKQGVLTGAEFEAEKKKILRGGAEPPAPGSGNKNKVSWGCVGCLTFVATMMIVGGIGSTCDNRAREKAAASVPAPVGKPVAAPAPVEKLPDAHAKELEFDSAGCKVLDVGIRFHDVAKRPLPEITYGRDKEHQIVIRVMPDQVKQGKEYD